MAWAFLTLNLRATATEAEARRAYRKSVLLHHPDRLANASEAVVRAAEERMGEVNHAWDVLQDHFRQTEERRPPVEDLWRAAQRPSGGARWVSFDPEADREPFALLEPIGTVAWSLIALSIVGLLALGALCYADQQRQMDWQARHPGASLPISLGD